MFAAENGNVVGFGGSDGENRRRESLILGLRIRGNVFYAGELNDN